MNVPSDHQEAEYGMAALTWLDHNQTDLVITDNRMPGFAGLELLQRLRESTKYHALPVIMLSGNLTESEKKTAYSHRVFAVLGKPCDFRPFSHLILIFPVFIGMDVALHY